MLILLSNLGTSFVLGLLTPTTAVCVLPMYPGFLSFLSNRLEGVTNKKKALLLFGLLVILGVVVFMLLLGLLFTTVLEVSLTNVIGIVSPIAFGLLLVISVLLIFDLDIGKFLPRMKLPTSKNSYLSAFFYGFFFGAIAVPCNPLFIATLFTRGLATSDFVLNLFNFLAFGVGIGFPLFVFSLLSLAASNTVIGFLTLHKRIINLFAGVIIMAISIYYLVFVFQVFNR